MKRRIEPIKSLNGICNNSKPGLYKQWIYKKDCYMRMCDYMQKINYSIQDLNELISDLDTFKPKNIIYTIVLVDWIREAYNVILKSIQKIIVKDYKYSQQNELKQYKDYFKAIRSFIVAHPLDTNSHPDFGFAGDKICVDIRDYIDVIPVFNNEKNHDFYYILNKDGLKEQKDRNADFYLFCYFDKLDNMKYFRKIACYFNDLYDTAKIYIDALYELDKYLKRFKLRNYKEGIYNE